MSDLPTRVRDTRKGRRWTQQKLADRAGVSLRTIQMFETRKSSPQGENLRRILRAVGIDESGEAVAEETRESWPPQIRVFLDMLGAYLATLDEAAQMDFIRDETRRLFETRDA